MPAGPAPPHSHAVGLGSKLVETIDKGQMVARQKAAQQVEQAALRHADAFAQRRQRCARRARAEIVEYLHDAGD